MPKALDEVCDRLEAVLSEVRATALKAGSGPSVVTPLQVLHGLRMSSPTSRAIYSSIVHYSSVAEKSAPHGYLNCTRMTLEALKALRLGYQPLERETSPGVTPWAETRPGDHTDMGWLVDVYMKGQDRPTTLALKAALHLAGFGGRITVERAEHVSVELVDGFTFNITALFGYPMKLLRPRIVCIDGYVEGVHELHHMLEAASTSAMPVVCFTRGMSDDVVYTLRVNLRRGSLVFIPVVVPTDVENLETVNAMKDIATVCGCDVMSSIKGELISAIDISEAPVVDSITFSPEKTTIVNPKRRGSAALLASQLADRRADAGTNEHLTNALDARVRSLSPRHVVIRLPDDPSYTVRSQAIDYVLRAFKALVDYGTVTINDERRLALTEYVAKQCSDACVRQLEQVGCVITSGTPCPLGPR